MNDSQVAVAQGIGIGLITAAIVIVINRKL